MKKFMAVIFLLLFSISAYATGEGSGTATISPVSGYTGQTNVDFTITYNATGTSWNGSGTLVMVAPTDFSPFSLNHDGTGGITVTAVNGVISSWITDGKSLTITTTNLTAMTGKIYIVWNNVTLPSTAGTRSIAIKTAPQGGTPSGISSFPNIQIISRTPTFTRTATPVYTGTFTCTPSFTPTFSRTITPFNTSTITPTYTKTITQTITPTFTISPTPTFTITATTNLTVSLTNCVTHCDETATAQITDAENTATPGIADAVSTATQEITDAKETATEGIVNAGETATPDTAAAIAAATAEVLHAEQTATPGIETAASVATAAMTEIYLTATPGIVNAAATATQGQTNAEGTATQGITNAGATATPDTAAAIAAATTEVAAVIYTATPQIQMCKNVATQEAVDIIATATVVDNIDFVPTMTYVATVSAAAYVGCTHSAQETYDTNLVFANTHATQTMTPINGTYQSATQSVDNAFGIISAAILGTYTSVTQAVDANFVARSASALSTYNSTTQSVDSVFVAAIANADIHATQTQTPIDGTYKSVTQAVDVSFKGTVTAGYTSYTNVTQAVDSTFGIAVSAAEGTATECIEICIGTATKTDTPTPSITPTFTVTATSTPINASGPFTVVDIAGYYICVSYSGYLPDGGETFTLITPTASNKKVSLGSSYMSITSTAGDVYIRGATSLSIVNEWHYLDGNPSFVPNRRLVFNPGEKIEVVFSGIDPMSRYYFQLCYKEEN